ncbi:MAG: YhfC family intramembrane metalloprotease [Firmicutes bacterium]|nr:YhfC family intramembrane metalloprotease [Bacillota bacterium]
MTELTKVGIEQFAVLGLGAAVAVIIPIAIALIWRFRKHEMFTTILVGAATFILFALILEKPIQNALVFPTQMGLAEHAASRFINARPLLLALVCGLFPGVFEETGRLLAFNTVLRNRRNRETAISYGIGHGGIEVIIVLCMTYITYIVYAVMINTGTFQALIDQVAAEMPSQTDAMYALADQIPRIGILDIGAAMIERVFAFLFHVGASILVFYAARDKGRFWLYSLAIVLHTAMDFIAGLYTFKIIEISMPALEAIIAVLGILTFLGAYFLLYKRDKRESEMQGI